MSARRAAYEAPTPSASPARPHNNFYPSQQNLLAASSDDNHSMPYQAAWGMRSGALDMNPEPPAGRFDSLTSLSPSMSASNLGSTDDHGSLDGHAARGARNWQQLQATEGKLLSAAGTFNLGDCPEYTYNGPEADDELHDPGKSKPRDGASRLVGDSSKINSSHKLSALGVANVAAVLLIILALLMIFAGWPIIVHVQEITVGNSGAFGMAGTNASGQVPRLDTNSAMIDDDTPTSAKTKKGSKGDDFTLIFSDEFNTDGRTFYEGEDPYWEAMDLYYSATKDLEMYDSDQAITRDGNLVLKMQQADPDTNGGLNYKSGMLQGWNKMCFRGGIVEVNLSLPGTTDVPGFWPAAWTLGNLGRAGYLATTDGTWPYASYTYCDIGTLHNQSYVGSQTEPPAVLDGDKYNEDFLSFLPGQRLSACSCPDSDHPGPKNSTNSKRWIGRSTPEIDLIEAQISTATSGAHASLSYQIAPFNAKYAFYNHSPAVEFFDNDDFEPEQNTYQGGVYQQACSGVAKIPSRGYNGDFMTWAIEFQPSEGDNTDGYITWIVDGEKVWTMTEESLKPDTVTEIHQRYVSREPMYVILNFGMSEGFTQVDLENLPFPSEYLIDYVRVYQKTGQTDWGCDGKNGDWPTTDYINDHIDAYANKNFTSWNDAGYDWPVNMMEDPDCGSPTEHY